PFVHRSEVSATELWRERSFAPMKVFKPVLFFYAPEPLSLLVQVDFYHGRPWTFFPTATDYQESTRVADFERPGVGRKGSKVHDLADRRRLSPAWTKPESGSAPTRDLVPFLRWRGLPSPKLPPFYSGAPWVYPGHPAHATATGRGSVLLTGMGVEWCGLRVGY